MLNVMEKELSVRTVRALMEEQGLTLSQACAILGKSPASVGRWERALQAGTLDTPKDRGGRPAEWVLCAEDRYRLRWLVSTPCSLALAVEYFVTWGRDGKCPLPVSDWCVRKCAALGEAPHFSQGSAGASPHLANKLEALMKTKGRWDAKIPKIIRQACALTEGEKSELRGEKARNDIGLKRQRLMEVREFNPVTGEEEVLRMLAGFGFCSDDMSLNEPFRNGQGIGRQMLCTHDIYSRRWLGVKMPGRTGDSYTAVDIADHFLSVITAVGLPYYWSLERGPWENDFINGCAVPNEWSDEDGMRWGGLSALFRIRRKFNPQGKTIEGAFNYLQARMAGRAVSVGRKRGGHEAVSRMIQRAKEGNEEAAQFIWGQGEAMESVWARMLEDNARAKRRQFLGDVPAVPDELWKETFQRRSLPPADAWRLMPVKVCRVVRAQAVYVKLEGYGALPYQFRVVGNDLPWRALDNGHRVCVAFHPGRPELGAAVASMELRGAFNRDGFRVGEMLGVAPHVPAVPMEDFTGGGDYSHQRAARLAVREEVRAGGMDDAGMVRISRAADGLGAALVISNQEEGGRQMTAGRGQKETRSLAEVIRAAREAAGTEEETLSTAARDVWAGVS